jgi:hypothetical protein
MQLCIGVHTMAEFYLRTHKLLPPRVGMIPLNQTTKTKQTDKTNRPRLQFPNTARPQHDEKKITWLASHLAEDLNRKSR